MKYAREERLEIGRKIYSGEITKYEASEQYDISINSARDYMRLYRDVNALPPKNHRGSCTRSQATAKPQESLEEIQSMSREELIDALVSARINEARLKKGYTVEGVGADRKFIRFGKKNTK